MAVTLSLFAGAGAQFFDNNGNVLSGGKIYTYQAGTTTPLAVYTSNSESAFHTNPIILDSAGRVPSGGEIWLQLGVGYKFVLRTSTEVLIATYDNIPSSAQPPAANDADSIMYEQGYTVTAGSFVVGKIYRIASVGTTDFTLIGATNNTVGTHFIATGVGAGTGTAELSQTVETKLQQIVSIEDFGAVGDGVTDDTAAFIACLNSNPAATGFDVQLQAKTYKINAAALYFTRRIRFFGVSRNVTVLDFSSCTTVVNAPYNAHIIFVHSNNITGSSSFANPITLPAGWVGTYGEMGGLFDLTVKCNSSVTDGNGVFYNVAANSSNILVRDANLHNVVVAGAATNLQTRGGTAGPSGLDIGGNSNNGVYINIKAQVAVNGDGIHVNGSDGNANLFLHPDASSNKGWGVNDASSLGNTYVQGHTAANAYGAYRSRPASANRSTFLSPYSEGGQGTDNSNTTYEMSARAIILGAQGVTPDGNFPAINSENDGLVAHNTISVMDAADTEDTGGTFGRVGRGLLSLRTTDGLLLEVKRSGSAYTTLFYGGASAIEFHNSSNGAINSTRPNFPNGFSSGTAHAQTVGTAAPTTGTWQRGNIVWNTTPSAGGYAGWICTAGGTPGTWKEFGAIVA